MDCQVLTSDAAVAAIAGEWEQLQKRANANIFVSYGWLDAWWRNLGKPHGWKLHIVTGRENGKLVAVAPLAVIRRRGLRILRWAGADTSDYNDFLLEDPSYAKPMWEAIRRSRQFDVARIREIHRDAVCLPPLNEFAKQSHTAFARQVRIEWPSSDVWMANLPSSTRQFYRKRMKKLEAEGKVRFDVYRQEPIDEIAFQAMIEQKTAWCIALGKSGVFDYPGIGPFLRQVAKLESANGNLHFSVLRCGETIVAVHLGFIVNGAMYCYMPTYNSEWHRFSPGKLLMMKCVGWAIDNGCREFDFLRGEEQFKNWLTNEARPIVDFSFAGSTLGWFAQFSQTVLQPKTTEPAPVLEEQAQAENLEEAA